MKGLDDQDNASGWRHRPDRALASSSNSTSLRHLPRCFIESTNDWSPASPSLTPLLTLKSHSHTACADYRGVPARFPASRVVQHLPSHLTLLQPCPSHGQVSDNP